MDETRERTATLIAGTPEREARILVVDPDAGTADAVCAVLRHEGHVVATAANTPDTLRALDERAFDMILLGLGPEKVASEAALSAVRAQLPDASIIILAGYADLDSALGAVRGGVFDYLMKPVDVDELRNTIQRALERQRLRRALAAAQAQERALRGRLRREVDDATEDLQRQMRELAHANQEMQEAQEQHDRFVAMVAHEMRGPLNPIISYAQLAKRSNLPAETMARYMDLIVEHAFRLNRLVDDLRTATRLSTGQFALRRERADVAAAVAEVVEQFTSSTYGRRFSLDGPTGPLFAVVDRDRVLQAVRNLIDNAVKYSVEDGAIEVRVWQDERYAAISVADYGAGLTEEEMRRIFEAFARGDHSQDVAGSGLGLYITRGIAEAHGGHLTVRNRTGEQRAQGAIFTITLPLGDATA
ncbi:MAG: response regulator [Ktedonobacterales bacterium]|nr:response regulator [Ktedonobacterales bacterium]